MFQAIARPGSHKNKRGKKTKGLADGNLVLRRSFHRKLLLIRIALFLAFHPSFIDGTISFIGCKHGISLDIVKIVYDFKSFVSPPFVPMSCFFETSFSIGMPFYSPNEKTRPKFGRVFNFPLESSSYFLFRFVKSRCSVRSNSSCDKVLKYSNVFRIPSSRLTLGSHPKISFALEISGCLCMGSS